MLLNCIKLHILCNVVCNRFPSMMGKNVSVNLSPQLIFFGFALVYPIFVHSFQKSILRQFAEYEHTLL